MRAMLMTAVGDADVLQMMDRPTPELRTEHDILVRLQAAGVNPVDTKLRANGTYFPERMPAILGCDGAGIVEAVGSAVSRFKPGDAVYFCHGGIGGDSGNYAEYTVIDERLAAAMPASVDFTQAAAAPLVLITAWESLHDRAHVNRGDKVLILAGAGGVGHVAIQLAKAAGAEVMTTVSDAAKADLCRELGADQVVIYTETDPVQAALDWTNGRGVDMALDTVGGAVFSALFPAIRYGGDLVTLLQPPVDCNWKTARLRNLRISLELMLTPTFYGMTDALRHHTGILERCAALFDAGQLRIELNRSLPLADAPQAHRLLEAGSMRGKLVLTMD